MSGHDLIITMQTLLAICGGVTVIVAGITSVAKMMSPIKELKSQVAEHETQIREILKSMDSQTKMQREICKSLIVIMNHEITGNSVDKLKAQQEELQTFLINN